MCCCDARLGTAAGTGLEREVGWLACTAGEILVVVVVGAAIEGGAGERDESL